MKLIKLNIYEYRIQGLDKGSNLWSHPTYDLCEAQKKKSLLEIEFENILESTWIERRNKFGWKWRKI
jgi:hypothetical protein